MRIFSEVIEQIKKEVPVDFEDRDMLFRSLDGRVDSMNYTAPEAQSLRWIEASDILGSVIGEADCDWKRKVAAIFNDTVDKEGD